MIWFTQKLKKKKIKIKNKNTYNSAPTIFSVVGGK